MNASSLIRAVASVYQMAHNQHFRYGDSQSVIPCADGLISCDRLIFRAIWNLGLRDQKRGGETVITMEPWLLRHGWVKITDQSKLMAGDIVLFRNALTTPNAGWHTFLLTDYVSPANVSKYDCGSQLRIDSVQPFMHCTLNQWNGMRWFYCAFRIKNPSPQPVVVDDYSFDADYYRYAYGDVVKAVGSSDAALRGHYESFGKKEGRAANCLLTPSYYKSKYKDLQKAFDKDWAKYINHWINYGVKEGRRGSVVFDQAYYKKTYGDLKKAFGNDKKRYYQHFIQYGMKEGRRGSADFDPKAYRKRYKDLDKAFGSNWPKYYMHYLVFGIKEKRKGT